MSVRNQWRLGDAPCFTKIIRSAEEAIENMAAKFPEDVFKLNWASMVCQSAEDLSQTDGFETKNLQKMMEAWLVLLSGHVDGSLPYETRLLKACEKWATCRGELFISATKAVAKLLREVQPELSDLDACACARMLQDIRRNEPEPISDKAFVHRFHENNVWNINTLSSSCAAMGSKKLEKVPITNRLAETSSAKRAATARNDQVAASQRLQRSKPQQTTDKGNKKKNAPSQGLIDRFENEAKSYRLLKHFNPQEKWCAACLYRGHNTYECELMPRVFRENSSHLIRWLKKKEMFVENAGAPSGAPPPGRSMSKRTKVCL